MVGKYLFSELLGAITGARQINGSADRDRAVRWILLRPNGNNTGRVNGFMAAVIVVTDMRKTHRLGDTRHLVDVAQETVQIEVITDAPFIAFKMGHIYRVEAYQRCPQANVGFR